MARQKIIEMGTEVSGNASPDCDGWRPPVETAYARIEHYHETSRYRRVVPIPKNAPLSVADLVHVKGNDCKAPVVLRGSSR